MYWRDVFFKVHGAESSEITESYSGKVSELSELSGHTGMKIKGFTVGELQKAAGNDWSDMKDSPHLIAAFANALRDSTKLSMGIVPEHYTKAVHCLNCGSVKLWESCPDVVHGCPWCITKRNKDD